MSRYNRGGYRNKSSAPVKIGKERTPAEATEAERRQCYDVGAVTDGSGIGAPLPSTLNELSVEDSDAGGPAVLNQGGDNVPYVGDPVTPEVHGQGIRELNELEVAVDADPELTPPEVETGAKAEAPEESVDFPEEPTHPEVEPNEALNDLHQEMEESGIDTEEPEEEDDDLEISGTGTDLGWMDKPVETLTLDDVIKDDPTF